MSLILSGVFKIWDFDKFVYGNFAAQSRLLKSSILVVGAGGLGSPALLYLAACGVGNVPNCGKLKPT